MIDSSAFQELIELPGHIVFIVVGYVSLELAQLAARAGANVTVVDRGPRPLKFLDPELVDDLVTYSRDIGRRQR